MGKILAAMVHSGVVFIMQCNNICIYQEEAGVQDMWLDALKGNAALKGCVNKVLFQLATSKPQIRSCRYVSIIRGLRTSGTWNPTVFVVVFIIIIFVLFFFRPKYLKSSSAAQTVQQAKVKYIFRVIIGGGDIAIRKKWHMSTIGGRYKKAKDVMVNNLLTTSCTFKNLALTLCI